jgi:hypothetical protein
MGRLMNDWLKLLVMDEVVVVAESVIVAQLL